MPSTAVFSTVIKYKVSRIEKDGTIIVDRFEFMEKDGSYIDSDKGTRVSKSGYYSTPSKAVTGLKCESARELRNAKKYLHDLEELYNKLKNAVSKNVILVNSEKP